jgi:flagellin-like protein
LAARVRITPKRILPKTIINQYQISNSIYMYTLGSVRLQRLKTQGTQSSRPHNAKKGISPVIATIILIAITIVIAIAVAGWVFGLFGSYSRTQAVTIVASASSCTASGNCQIMVSNQGGSAVTVVSASINGMSASLNTLNTVIPAGSSEVVTVTLTGYTAGQTVQVQLGLSNGNTLSTTLVVNS